MKKQSDGKDLAQFFALMAFQACRNMEPDAYIPVNTRIQCMSPGEAEAKGAKTSSFTKFHVSGEMVSPTSSGTVSYSVEIYMRPHESSEFVWVIETGDEESGILKKYFIDINDEPHPFFFSYNPHRGAVNIWPVVIFPDYQGSEHSSEQMVFYNIFGDRGPARAISLGL